MLSVVQKLASEQQTLLNLIISTKRKPVSILSVIPRLLIAEDLLNTIGETC